MAGDGKRSEQITRLLIKLRDGSADARAALFEAVYPELRRRAARYLRTERSGHTLQATALVNEAYMELMGQAKAGDWKDRSHFFAVAAQAMRRILVDYARNRKAAKRDGGKVRVEFTDVLAVSEQRLDEVLAIDEALTRLAGWDARQCQIVEMRFFAGLSIEETAEALGISAATVKRDWDTAKLWLRRELSRR